MGQDGWGRKLMRGKGGGRNSPNRGERIREELTKARGLADRQVTG